MAEVKLTMAAIGTEPQTCTRPFRRGEIMSAVEYTNGDPGGWHTKECVHHWVKTGEPLCLKGGED